MSVIDYATSGNNAVGGINIATGTSPANVDNALRKIVDDIGEGLANGYFATALPATTAVNYTVLTTDRGKLFNCTSALTLALPAAATAAAGFMFWVKANGAAVILDPNAAELIDGAATVTIASGSSAFVVCTGTAWVTAFVATSYDWAAAVVAASGKATPIDADSIGIVDSAASNVLKETTIGELRTVFLAGTPTLSTIEGLSLVAGDTLYATAADTITRLAKGTASQVLTMNAGATAPEWQSVTSIDYGAGNAALAYGDVGTYVLGYVGATGITEGNTTAGSNVEPAGFTDTAGTVADDVAFGTLAASKGGAALSGTWRIMGRSNLSSGSSRGRITLFLRVA